MDCQLVLLVSVVTLFVSGQLLPNRWTERLENCRNEFRFGPRGVLSTRHFDADTRNTRTPSYGQRDFGLVKIFSMPFCHRSLTKTVLSGNQKLIIWWSFFFTNMIIWVVNYSYVWCFEAGMGLSRSYLERAEGIWSVISGNLSSAFGHCSLTQTVFARRWKVLIQFRFLI